jgi:hypothetical protein
MGGGRQRWVNRPAGATATVAKNCGQPAEHPSFLFPRFGKIDALALSAHPLPRIFRGFRPDYLFQSEPPRRAEALEAVRSIFQPVVFY